MKDVIIMQLFGWPVYIIVKRTERMFKCAESTFNDMARSTEGAVDKIASIF